MAKANNPLMGSGFYQAPDVNVSGRSLPTPGFAGITTSDKKLKELSQFYSSLQVASKGVAAFRGRYDSGEKADAYKASQEDIVRNSAEIEINDESWEMGVWETDEDGENTGKLITQEALSQKIHENLEVLTEGRSDVFKEAYLARMTPVLSKQLIERGIGRRANQLNNQLDDIALSVIGTASGHQAYVDQATAGGVAPEDISGYEKWTKDEMQESFNEVKEMFPIHTNETDEEHEARVKATYVEKVVPQLVDVWSSTGNMAGLQLLLNKGKSKDTPWRLNPVEKVKVLSKAQTGFYDSLYQKIQQPIKDANGILAWHLPDLMEGNEQGKNPELEKITSPGDLMEYLNEPEIQDPNSVYYLDPTRKAKLVRDFLTVDEIEHGEGRLHSSMVEAGGIPLDKDRKYFFPLMSKAGAWDSQTGTITDGLMFANMAGNAGVGKEAGPTLFQQIESPDDESRTQAAIALVMFSQHANPSAWREIMDSDDIGPHAWNALAQMDQWADTHSILDTGFEGSQSLNQQNLVFLTEKLTDGLRTDDERAITLTSESLLMAKDELNININTIMESMVGKDKELHGWIDNTMFSDLLSTNPFHSKQFEQFYLQQYTIARQTPGMTQDAAKALAKRSLAQLMTTKFDIAMIGGDSTGGILVPMDGMNQTERWSVQPRTMISQTGDRVSIPGTTVNHTWNLLQTQLTGDEGRLYAGGVPVNSGGDWEDNINQLAPMAAPGGGGWIFVTHTGDPLMIKVPRLDNSGAEVKDSNGETVMDFKLAKYSLNDLRAAEREQEAQSGQQEAQSERDKEKARKLKAVNDREVTIKGSKDEHLEEYNNEVAEMKKNNSTAATTRLSSAVSDNTPRKSVNIPTFPEWWVNKYGGGSTQESASPDKAPKRNPRTGRLPNTQTKKDRIPKKPLSEAERKRLEINNKISTATSMPQSGSTPSGKYPPSVQE